jgi:hypothetical protein
MSAILKREQLSVDFEKIRLPAFPQVVWKLDQLLRTPRYELKAVRMLLEGEPALSAKLLRLVNSSYYAVPGGVGDLGKAIRLVGYTTLSQLVLSSMVSGLFVIPVQSGVNFRAFWKHCFATAKIAEMLGGESEDYTAGLLFDLGFLVLRMEGVPREGVTPSLEYGAIQELARIWNLPKAVRTRFDEGRERLIQASHYADQLGYARDLRPMESGEVPPELESLRKGVDASVQQMESMLQGGV